MKEDRFIIFVYEVSEYITHHVQEIIIGVGVVVIAAAAGYLYSNMQQSRHAEAAQILAPALTAVQQERYGDAAPIFERIREEFGGTSSAAEATIRLADAYFRQGKTDEALTTYRQYIDEYGGDDEIVTISAEAGIASCIEQQGKYLDAAKRYHELADQYNDSYMLPRFLLDAGRCYQAADQTDQAKIMYDKVVNTYEDSRYGQEAKLALTTL